MTVKDEDTDAESWKSGSFNFMDDGDTAVLEAKFDSDGNDISWIKDVPVFDVFKRWLDPDSY
jgi:hypothetical protein